jgi:antitoxin component of MazEF toxin-antitoxin module
MIKKLQKIGNSSGIVLDRAILGLLKFEKDEEVELSIVENGLLIKPVRRGKR